MYCPVVNGLWSTFVNFSSFYTPTLPNLFIKTSLHTERLLTVRGRWEHLWISKDSLITSYCSNCILWKLERKIQWSFKIFLFNWNIIISKWISWTQAIFKSVSKWLNNWLKTILIFKVKEVIYKMCLQDKLP